MNEYAKKIKRKLTMLIEKMSANLGGFVRNPEKDFTRKRKLPLETVMHLLMHVGEQVYTRNCWRQEDMR